MFILPAIDLKDGKCVRLLQGRKEDVTVYSDDPGTTARRWRDQGASYLHVVDLDGAFTAEQKNLKSIEEIRSAVPEMTIEVGGGIRDRERIDRLVALGVDRVILGTVAAERPELVKEAAEAHPGRVLVGIDAKDGMVAVKGWVEVTKIGALELARRMETEGAAAIIYTDISRDGMLTGPNLEAMSEMVGAVDIPVIASGGISKMEDIRNLMEIKGLWGAITGKAIYSGSIELSEALALAEGGKK